MAGADDSLSVGKKLTVRQPAQLALSIHARSVPPRASATIRRE
jgi:hypothetical protein